jgi:hypothetical protein
MIKRIVYLLLACLYAINNVFAYTPTCSTVGSLPYGASWTAPNKVLGTQVLGNDNILLTPIDTVCGTDLPLLPGKADAETITGAWTFSGGVVFSSSGSPTTNVECTGTSQLCPYESVVRDTGSQTITGTKTFSSVPVSSEECDSTGEVCPYESVVRDVGNQTVAGEKTFSGITNFDVSPTVDVDASTASQIPNLGQIQTSISAITAGGASFSTSAPVGSCTAGATHNRLVNNGIVTYVCTGSSGWVESNADAVSKAVAYTGAVTVSSSGSFTNAGITALNGTVTFGSMVTIDAGGNKITNGATPTASTDYVIKSYVDAASPKIFAVTSSPMLTAGVASSLFGTGAGSLTIDANTLQAGSIIKARIPLLYNEDGSPENATWLVKLGSTTIATTGSVADPTVTGSGLPVWVEVELLCTSAGASGSVSGEIRVHFLGATTNGTMYTHRFAGTQTIDTTASQTLDVTLNYAGATGQSFAAGLGHALLYK